MKRASSGRARPKPCASDFFAKYKDLVADLFRAPGEERSATLQQLAGAVPWTKPLRMSRFTSALNQLKEVGFSRLLEAADRENCPEAFKETLEVLLLGFLNVTAPKGVFVPPQGSPGAPLKEVTTRINDAWIEMGRPWPIVPKDLDRLARQFYSAEFAKSSPASKKRKNLRERIRGTVLRGRMKLVATKSQ